VSRLTQVCASFWASPLWRKIKQKVSLKCCRPMDKPVPSSKVSSFFFSKPHSSLKLKTPTWVHRSKHPSLTFQITSKDALLKLWRSFPNYNRVRGWFLTRVIKFRESPCLWMKLKRKTNCSRKPLPTCRRSSHWVRLSCFSTHQATLLIIFGNS